MSDTPNRPVRSADVPWESFDHGDAFSIRYRRLSAATPPQPYKIGVVIEELAAGKQNCPAHYHLYEEEHVLILEGALTVRVGEARHVMETGDYIRFAAGDRAEHCLFNHTGQVCRYLLVGDRLPNDVVVYPDSGKILVRATGEIYDKAHPMDYWDDEGAQTGKPPAADR